MQLLQERPLPQSQPELHVPYALEIQPGLPDEGSPLKVISDEMYRKGGSKRIIIPSAVTLDPPADGQRNW